MALRERGPGGLRGRKNFHGGAATSDLGSLGFRIPRAGPAGCLSRSRRRVSLPDTWDHDLGLEVVRTMSLTLSVPNAHTCTCHVVSALYMRVSECVAYSSLF